MSLYLVKYGEIALKGKNRHYFEQKLIQAIRNRLKGMDASVSFISGRIYVESEDERTLRLLQDTFGLVEICEARKTPLDMKALKEAAVEEMKEATANQPTTFKVETRRSNKHYELDSMQVSAELGAHLLSTLSNLTVDVHQPKVRLEVEVREDMYLYVRRYQAVGGIPYGTGGKTVLLMSGGIDSPVAGYQMARRGVEIVPLHFHAKPFTSEMALDKVRELVKRLTYYTGWLYLYHMNISQAQIILREKCDERFFTILQRRLMTRLANELAQQKGALAITTGENIAQVASQTMEGLRCTDDASTLPVFRPLISFDKNDIIKIAKNIETFETSILPFEDCCTVFLPEKVATRPKLEEILDQEKKVDLEELLQITRQSLVKEKIT